MLHRNLKTKLFALFLALVLWCYLLLTQENPMVERAWKVPVEFRHIPSDLVGYAVPQVVELVVRGRKQATINLNASVLKAFIDASAFGTGERWVEVSTEQPPGVNVRVQPTQVKLVIEHLLSTIKQVEFTEVGDPPPNYELDKPTGKPAMVTVFGPESKVDKVRRVVAVINLARISVGLSQPVAVSAVDVDGAKVEGVKLMPPQISIRVPVKEMRSSRTIPVAVDILGPPARGYRIGSIAVEPSVVTVVGPSDRLKQITAIHTEDIQAQGANRDREVTVRLRMPEGISALDVPEVKVKIRIVPERPSAGSSGIPL